MKMQVLRPRLRPIVHVAIYLGAVLVGVGGFMLRSPTSMEPNGSFAAPWTNDSRTPAIYRPTGAFAVQGDVTLGDSTADSVTITGDLFVHGRIIQLP